MSHSALITGAIGLLTALLITSCTDRVDDETAPTPTPTVTVTEPVPSRPAPVFDPDDSVLNVAVPEPSTLDPMRLGDPGSVLVARQLYEGLTRWDPVRERVRPAAAEAWRVGDGGRLFRFKLREGMTFHDGTPVRSKDFKFAFERIAQKNNASDLAYTLELVEGFEAANRSGSTQRLSGISTPKPLTLVIRLSEPFYEFPSVLTHPGLVPLSAAAVRDVDEFLAVPTGNGPFRIAQAWAPGEPVILEAFPGFIETPDLDGIRFLPYPDAAASWLPFVQGDLHVAEVPAGQIEEAQERFGEEGFQPFLAGYYYGFNLDSKQMQDRKLRKAINRAIDRDAIANTIYKGSMELPRGIVPRGMPGFQEDICLPACRYSKAAAERLAGKLSRKDRKITLEFTQGDPHGQVAQFVKRDLEAVGFRVRVRSYPFPSYLKRLRNGKHAVYRFGWIAEYPTPDVFLSPLFDSASPDNHSAYSSQRIDALLTEAHAERSDGRRLQLYAQAEKAILREMPVVPIGSFTTHWAAKSSVRRIKFDVMGGFDAADIFLEEE